MLRKIISGDKLSGKIAVKLILRSDLIAWDGPCSAGIVAESKISELSSTHATFQSSCTRVVHGSFVDLYICISFPKEVRGKLNLMYSFICHWGPPYMHSSPL